MSANKSEYEVEIFREKGFQRKECVKCGKHFWTVDANKETCGDPPCDEYGFIGHPLTKKKYSLHEMREAYLSYFERNGHGRVSRYPIVARWRNDVFFTQASIYCFQPWVLNGAVKPPANPLTISQTCVRFNDIDNVGKTGRHFTMFEMMAHHCFNTKEKPIYFKDRTVELCHNLLTKELGINPEVITYIESTWAGGGNSGPCFETLVSGIELSTLVFMMYREKDGLIKEMDMQVVDTGYGLERFTWVSQGTTSAYEAVFGSVLKKLKDEAHVTGDPDILGAYSQVAGMMSVESNADLKVLREKAAIRLGIPTAKLVKEIVPMENLYAVCDHTRALMFMLQDGVLPSNAKEGYFGRMLVRRAIRAINSLKLDMPLSDILGMQVDFFQRDFPELKDNKHGLMKLADVEEEKYRKTLEKGKTIVSRLDEKIRKAGEEDISLNELISLYDSQGITPDLVKEFSSLKVDVPDDFYIQVGKMHEKPVEEKEEEKTAVQVPAGVPPTILGYYDDSETRKFTARVLAVYESYMIFDKTYFYPEGGGQETDLGTINDMPVAFVQKVGNVVVHEVRADISGIKPGMSVQCMIDSPRRNQLAIHHTATHIINGAARRILGSHVWQTGAHKSVKGARLDITHYSSLSDDELKAIEALANKTVFEHRPVGITNMERVAAESTYGFRLYQGGVVPGGEIRVVSIKDWDVEACGGIHLSNTKDAGLIKITGSKRIQDGVVRLEFAAGPAAQAYLEEQKKIAEKITSGDVKVSEKDLARVADIFSVKVADLTKTLKRFTDEWCNQKTEICSLEQRLKTLGKTYAYSDKYSKDPCDGSYEGYVDLFESWKSQKKELDYLRNELSSSMSEGLEKKLEKEGTAKEIVYDMNVKVLSELAKKLTEKPGRTLILINVIKDKANIVVASSESKNNSSELAKKLSAALGGGSYGDARLAMGGGASKEAESVLKDFIL
ncbi:MAG: alanine--tRNA ligase [Candidatus Altiarchaeia archaeon]